jgi:transposase
MPPWPWGAFAVFNQFFGGPFAGHVPHVYAVSPPVVVGPPVQERVVFVSTITTIHPARCTCIQRPCIPLRPYPPEFRQRIVELVRKGRTPEELGQQFEPSAQAIRNWVKQAALDAGQRLDGLTTEEREELRRLRRENRQLREERAILSKAAAWFARETNAIPSKDSSS